MKPERKPKPQVPAKRYQPVDSHTQAKRLIVDVLRVSGGRLDGKTRLYKAFYAAHLFYTKQGAGFLTEHPIARMPNGPGIDAGDQLLRELEAAGVLRISTRRVGDFIEYSFELLESPTEPIDAARSQAIALALRWAGGRTAAELSSETHRFSMSWQRQDDGDEVDIYSDMLSPEERGDRERLLAEVERKIRAAIERPA